MCVGAFAAVFAFVLALLAAYDAPASFLVLVLSKLFVHDCFCQ
jgi:hypothetical protein